MGNILIPETSQNMNYCINISATPRSGRRIEIPEVDRATWFPLDEARTRINKGQLPLLDELERVTANQD